MPAKCDRCGGEVEEVNRTITGEDGILDPESFVGGIVLPIPITTITCKACGYKIVKQRDEPLAQPS